MYHMLPRLSHSAAVYRWGRGAGPPVPPNLDQTPKIFWLQQHIRSVKKPTFCVAIDTGNNYSISNDESTESDRNKNRY